jgi:hypothetical protein
MVTCGVRPAPAWADPLPLEGAGAGRAAGTPLVEVARDVGSKRFGAAELDARATVPRPGNDPFSMNAVSDTTSPTLSRLRLNPTI